MRGKRRGSRGEGVHLGSSLTRRMALMEGARWSREKRWLVNAGSTRRSSKNDTSILLISLEREEGRRSREGEKKKKKKKQQSNGGCKGTRVYKEVVGS